MRLKKPSEGTRIVVTPLALSEGRVSLWHRCTPEERERLGDHGDVGIHGRYVGLACGEANLRSRVALFLDRVSLGDLPSTAAGEL